MKITEILMERLSSILYHSTDLSSVLNILKNDEFRLTTDISSPSDSSLRKNDKTYYMSFSRSKTGEYHYPVGWIGTMLVIDGDKLNANYSGKAVNYWGKDFNKDEMEDRLYNKSGYIPNATKYIKEIHIYIKPDARDQERYSKFVRMARKIYILSKKNNIQTYFYNDDKAYNLLQKEKSIPISSIKLEPIDPTDKPYVSIPRNYFAPYMELLSIDDYEKLSKNSKDLLYKISWYKTDYIKSLEADIKYANTNNNLRKKLDNFLNKIKTLGLKNVEDVINHIQNKFDK
jgi:hypothetical protein